jgi:DNA polymerase-4
MSRGRIPPAERQQGPHPDDGGCRILHVDMDAFYASVEVRRHPQLRGRPVIVGGEGRGGVVLSATYEARRDGVHAAMPTFRARRLCPQARIIRPDFAAYAAASAGVFEVFRSMTPWVEGLSLDEAFLDVGGASRQLGTPRQIGESIRARIHDEQGITCSVGVAANKFLAKLASTRAKPDGLLVVPRDGVRAFLDPLPVAALWGVGDKTEGALRRLGLNTVGDVAATPAATLRETLGAAVAIQLTALARGIDDRPVVVDGPDKSIGAEETFDHDIDDPATIRRELLRLAEKVARRLRARSRAGRTVSIKLRFTDFSTISRARTITEPTDLARDIYTVASELFDAVPLAGRRLRLVGVRVEQLQPADAVAHQPALGEPDRGWRDAERAVDRATRRFGPSAVRPASLVRPPDTVDSAGSAVPR